MNRIQGKKFLIVNPRWLPKIQDGRHEIQFFDISTSDDGDFTRIIEIALYSFFITPDLRSVYFVYELYYVHFCIKFIYPANNIHNDDNILMQITTCY